MSDKSIANGRIEIENGYWLLIDKPSGITSHDVIDKVRDWTGEKKAGHAGTLDPLATGLLVIAVGKATKQLGQGLEGRKKYRTVVQLGLATPTGDSDAKWSVEVKPPHFEIERIIESLEKISRLKKQVPPMVSAVKFRGQRYYKLALRGWWLAREERDIAIEEIQFIGYDVDNGRIEFEVAGGGGLYVRSIVRDLGASLGIPASLIELRRLEAGTYSVEDAVTLDEFSEYCRN